MAGPHIGNPIQWNGVLHLFFPEPPGSASFEVVASFNLSGHIVAVPEPSTALLIALGSGLLAARGRRNLLPQP